MSKRDLYVQACEAYQAGRPIMTDIEFDELERELRAEGHTDLTDKTHDAVSGSDIDDKTFSIRPLESWNEILAWVQQNIEHEFFATLKYDGVCAKIQDGREFKAQSRGRDTMYPWDYTETLKHVVPKNDEELLIVGEAFVPADLLDYFKKKYNDDIYKLPRSAAVSLLRTPRNHDLDDLKKLKFVAYRLDRDFEKKSDMYDYMWSLGYETPSYETFRIPDGADIKQFLQDMFASIDAKDNYAPSDGIVLELNDLTVVPDIVNGKYLSTMIACKVDKWGELVHTGVVKGIIHTPKKGNFGCVLEIEPVTLPDGVTQRRINAFNIGIVIREKIEKGSIIRFRRKANGMSVLVYGNGHEYEDTGQNGGEADDL